MNTFRLLRAAVENVLRTPHAHDWTIQGMGMLRCYLSKEIRIHVWDSRYRVPNVTMLHNHPWDFSSMVIAGQLDNYRYETDPWLADECRSVNAVDQYRILCGQGAKTLSEPWPMRIWAMPIESYREGEVYSQKANEIHMTHAWDGSVTIIERKFLQDEDHALVYVPRGESFVSAEPRPATRLEVLNITRPALHRWFRENPNYL